MTPYLSAVLRREIRRLIDQRKRELEEVTVCPIGYGTNYGYRIGCRCELCREASRDQKRAWRAANHDAYVAYEQARSQRRREAGDWRAANR